MKKLFNHRRAVFSCLAWAGLALNAHAQDNARAQDNNGEETSITELTQNHIIYTPAYNFDFGETKQKNWVHHVNLFSPDLCGGHKHKLKKWGFNTGIMKLRYSNDDTLISYTRTENVMINPLNPPTQQGDPYLRQTSDYRTSVVNADWSFYVQPLWRITPWKDTPKLTDHKSVGIYAHGHAELFVNRMISTTTIANKGQDTAYLDTAQSLYVRGGLTDNSTDKQTSSFGYFGGGLTFNIVPWPKGSFFFQPTVGWTNDNARMVGGRSYRSRSQSESKPEWRFFYLVRAYYQHRLSDDAAGILGVDIRGIADFKGPKYNNFGPNYAVYLGANLNVAGLLAIIGIRAGEGTRENRDPKGNTPPPLNRGTDDE